MPTTRENSCQIGAGTTWCTARTSGSNLFYSYVARPKEDIVLFYVMKDNAETANDKISIGFVNGKPYLAGQHGGLTVNSDNEGLQNAKLKRIFGGDFQRILNVLSEKSKNIGGQHPAKAKMIEAAQDVEVLKNLTKGLSVQERIEFYEMTVLSGQGAGVDTFDVLNFIINSDDDKIKKVALKPGIRVPDKILAKLASSNNDEIRVSVAFNSNAPMEALALLASDDNISVRGAVARNISAPKHILQTLANDANGAVRKWVAWNRKAPEEILKKLSTDTHEAVRAEVGRNYKTPVDALIKLSNDKNKLVLFQVIYNKKTPMEILNKLANSENKEVVRVAEDEIWEREEKRKRKEETARKKEQNLK
jgi:hypothetical protein